MPDDTVTLKLDEHIMMANDKPMKDFDTVKDKNKIDANTGNKIPKTPQELDDESGPMTRGAALSRMLMNSAKPADLKMAALLNRWSRKVSNIMVKSKKELEIDLSQIDELWKILETVPLDAGVQLTLGDVAVMLEDAKIAIQAKKVEKLK